MKNSLIALTVFSSLAIGGAEPVEWTQCGAGAGGNNHSIVCSPSDHNVVFSIPDVGGMYVSNDGGKHWQRTAADVMRENRGYRMSTVSVASGNPQVIYATTPHMLWTFFQGGKWGGNFCKPETELLNRFKGYLSCGVIRSADGGKTWDLRPGSPEMIGDGLAVDPDDENSIWIATGDKRNNGGLRYFPPSHSWGSSICRSADGGKTWDFAYAGVSSAEEGRKNRVAYGNICISHNSPKANRTLYVCSTIGVFKSIDHGKTWISISGNLPHLQVERIDLYDTPDGKNHIVYAAMGASNGNSGIYCSVNGSGKWENITGNLFSLNSCKGGILHISVSRQNPDIIYVAPGRGRGTSEPEQKGLFKTVDGGKTWKNIYRSWRKDANKDLENCWNLMYNYNDIVESMSLSCQDDNVLYVADRGCMLFKTIDGGESWRQIYTNKQMDDTFQSRGMESTCYLDLVFEKGNPDKLCAAENDFSLQVSRNNGRTWSFHSRSQINEGVFKRKVNPNATGTTSLAVSPENPKVFFAGIHGWGREGFDGIFAVSNDAGEHWDVRSTKQGNRPAPMPPGVVLGTYNRYITSILPFDNNHILITKRTGMYESFDGGRSWKKIPFQEGAAHRFVSLIRGAGDVVYGLAALTPRDTPILTTRGAKYVPGKDPLKENYGGVYKSTDKGRTWSRMTVDPAMSNPRNLAVSPDGKTLYLAVGSWYEAEGSPNFRYYPGALYRSRDNGKKWERLLVSRNRPDGSFSSPVIHPLFPEVVYVIGCEVWGYSSFTSILRSCNGGDSWEDVTGSAWNQFQNGLRINPERPDTIYLLSGGCGLYIGKDRYLQKRLTGK